MHASFTSQTRDNAHDTVLFRTIYVQILVSFASHSAPSVRWRRDTIDATVMLGVRDVECVRFIATSSVRVRATIGVRGMTLFAYYDV